MESSLSLQLAPRKAGKDFSLSTSLSQVSLNSFNSPPLLSLSLLLLSSHYKPLNFPPTTTTSRRNLSVAALALVALTAFAGSVFAAEAETAAASGGVPPLSAAEKVDATAAVMEAEGKELERADGALEASKAAAAVDPDHLLSHDEMDAMMKDAGFSLNRETGLYDPPAGVDRSTLSRQVLLPDSGADHAAFANMLLDQQYKFIQVEHGEFSLPAGEKKRERRGWRWFGFSFEFRVLRESEREKERRNALFSLLSLLDASRSLLFLRSLLLSFGREKERRNSPRKTRNKKLTKRTRLFSETKKKNIRRHLPRQGVPAAPR